MALGVFTVTLASGAFSGAGFSSNHQDLATKYASLLFGITNACSSIAGTVAVYATGEVLESTKSWNTVWEFVAATYFIGNLFYLGFARAEKIFP